MGRNGQLWNGKGGFAYKKSGGAGGRKNPPYGLITGTPQNIWNKYIPGAGVGGLNTSVRRAKMRLATSCNKNQVCGSFYVGLGMNWDIPPVSVPEPPVITAIDSGDKSLIVYFTQVNTSPAVITNYMYSVNGVNGPFIQFIPPRTNNPLTIYGLTNGTQYNVVIKALNYAGKSSSSNIMSGIPMTVPSQPILLTATPGNSEITLTFVCNNDGGSPITDILYSTNGGATFASAATTTNPIIIGGLTNGVFYTVEIIAVNSVGLSVPSVPTSLAPIGPIGPVTQFTNVGVSSWTAPQGITSVEYLVVGGGGGSGATHDGGSAGGGGGGMVLTGTIPVIPGTQYTVIVGDGGNGGIGLPPPQTRETNGESGANSQFSTIIALGGSGGYRSRSDGLGNGGTSAIQPNTASTGGRGGSFSNGGGGGGGNSTNGVDGTLGIPRTGGAGGSGTVSNITGSFITYGQGGAGGNAQSVDNAIPGVINTGNGAKGPGTPFGSQTSGAKGGSGIVVLKY